MNSSSSDDNPNSLELEHLSRLETIVQRGLDVDVEAGNALAEISDARLYRGAHETFAAYLRERWGMTPWRGLELIHAAEIAASARPDSNAPPPAAETPVRSPGGDGAGVLANLLEQARDEMGGDDVTAFDLRLTIHKRQPWAQSSPEPSPNPWRAGAPDPGPTLRQLRWLLAQSSGTIADVAHQLDAAADALDEDALEQLRFDLLVVDDELAAVKALLAAPVDWDAEYGRLIAGEIPAFDDDGEDDERE
ncbi:MAG: hypothetical protein ACJ780_05995 [Solirubrobacteraceae bacterium]